MTPAANPPMPGTAGRDAWVGCHFGCRPHPAAQPLLGGTAGAMSTRGRVPPATPPVLDADTPLEIGRGDVLNPPKAMMGSRRRPASVSPTMRYTADPGTGASRFVRSQRIRMIRSRIPFARAAGRSSSACWRPPSRSGRAASSGPPCTAELARARPPVPGVPAFGYAPSKTRGAEGGHGVSAADPRRVGDIWERPG